MPSWLAGLIGFTAAFGLNVVANLIADAIWFHFDLDSRWKTRAAERRIKRAYKLKGPMARPTVLPHAPRDPVRPLDLE